MRSIAMLIALFSPLFIVKLSIAKTPDWAAPFIISSDEPWSQQQLIKQGDLYDCGLEKTHQEYCSIFSYYETEVEARVFVRDGIASQLTLTASSNRINDNNLQYALRRDGFTLVSVEVAGHKVVVEQALQSMAKEQLDRDIVMLINDRRYHQASKQLIWEKPQSSTANSYVTYQINPNMITVILVLQMENEKK